VASSTDENVRRVTSALFGDSGLASCTDAVSFEDAWRQAGDMLQRVPEQLRRYCADKVEPLLRRNMEAGCAGTLFNCARYKFRHDTVTPVLELKF